MTNAIKGVLLFRKGQGKEEGYIQMKNLLRKLKVPLAALFLVFWVMSAATLADAGPRRRRRPPHSVAEPTTLAMLGAGLVSVSLYALKKRKRG